MKKSDNKKLDPKDINTSAIINKSKCFRDVKLNLPKCRAAMISILQATAIGVRFTDKEQTELFFSLTQLMHQQDVYIHRLLESDMKSHFLFDNKYVERGKMICLEENEGDIVRPWLSISYKLPFTYLCRKKEYAFDAGLEYVVNEDYNVIRFYLSDISYNCILWDDIVKDNLLKQIPARWQKGKDENCDIYMGFEVDNSFEEEKSAFVILNGSVVVQLRAGCERPSASSTSSSPARHSSSASARMSCRCPATGFFTDASNTLRSLFTATYSDRPTKAMAVWLPAASANRTICSSICGVSR